MKQLWISIPSRFPSLRAIGRNRKGRAGRGHRAGPGPQRLNGAVLERSRGFRAIRATNVRLACRAGAAQPFAPRTRPRPGAGQPRNDASTAYPAGARVPGMSMAPASRILGIDGFCPPSPSDVYAYGNVAYGGALEVTRRKPLQPPQPLLRIPCRGGDSPIRQPRWREYRDGGVMTSFG